MNIIEATREYEAWAGAHTSLIRRQLVDKHNQMADEPFLFLRGTFYRWAQEWPKICPGEAKSIKVLAVGDLHIASFGTWRDGFGRLVWGVADFDEACSLAYSSDLVRLAVSAALEDYDGELPVRLKKVCDLVLEGYREALNSGGRPFVLEERHKWLRKIALTNLDQPAQFWRKLDALPSVRKNVPGSALKAFKEMLPEPSLPHRIVRREAGTGSLGHPRFVAVADWRGGQIALEAKAVVPSAALWVNPGKGPTATQYQRLSDRSVRCPDPAVRSNNEWLVRRLAPDSSAIEIESLRTHRDRDKLLRAMGWECGNAHLGTPAAIPKILKDLKQRPVDWLPSAAKDMAKAMLKDWKEWKRR